MHQHLSKLEWLKVQHSGIVIVDPEEPEKYIIQSEKLGLTLLNLTENEITPNFLDIISAHVVLVKKENMNRVEQFLPPDFLVYPPGTITQQMLRRHSYWLKHHNRTRQVDNQGESSSLWEPNPL